MLQDEDSNDSKLITECTFVQDIMIIEDVQIDNENMEIAYDLSKQNNYA